MKRRLILALKVSVSLGLLGWVVHTAVTRDGAGALGARLAALSWPFVGLAVIVQLGAVGAGVLRWRVLLASRGITLPLGWLARSYLVGRFAGTFTPSTAGLDVYRVWAVARHTGERARATAAIVVEKIVGLLALSLACVLLLPLGGTRFFGPSAIAAAACILVGSIAALLVLRSGALVRVRWLARLRLGELDRGVLARATGLGLISHIATSAVFVATAAALGLDVSPLSVLVVGNAIVVATLIPVSVGGLGVREGVAVALLAAVGISATEATLVALLDYLVGQVPRIAGELLTLGRRSRARSAPALATIATPASGTP